MWDLKWGKGGFIFKQDQFYSITLLYHIFTSHKICVPKSSVQHADTTLYPGGLSSCGCLEDKGWKLLNPHPFSWVLLSLETLANIGLACLSILEVDSVIFHLFPVPPVWIIRICTLLFVCLYGSHGSYSVHCLPTIICKCTESLL